MSSSGRPLAGVAVYTMFRGHPEQLFGWCDFHLAQGAAHLYVLLDRPDPEVVAGLPEHPDVSWEVVEQPAWDALYPSAAQHVERSQVDGFLWTARRARTDGHDFLAFVDADELLVLHEPLVDLAAARSDAAALVVPVREMWFDAAKGPDGPFSATLALRPSMPPGDDRDRALGWRSQFLRNGVLGHDAGKSIYRLSRAVSEVTVHRPRPGAASTVVLPYDAAELLHFDSGDVPTWNAKWGGRIRQDSVARGLWPHRLAQQNLYAHALRRDPAYQERFFGEFFSLDEPTQGLLDDQGLLETIDVRDAVMGPVTARADIPPRGGLLQLDVPTRAADFQFAMVCDRRFVRPTLATMVSVLAQMGEAGSVRFVILGDGLDDPDVALLRTLEQSSYEVEVMVRDVTPDLDRDVGTDDAKRATFGRMYLIDHLPEQRTVYLDGDVLATREFTELFSTDLGDACLAGVSDSAALRLVDDPASVPVAQGNRLMGITDGDPLEYLNGGVLVLALEHPDFRRLALQARALVVRQGRALTQRDQDAINMAFAGRKHRLPSTYNYMTQFFVSERAAGHDLARLKYDAADASLIHFSGRIKPWEKPEDEFYNALYRRLVNRAEERVGVTCGLWFSAPPGDPAGWGATRWVDTLARWDHRRDVTPTTPPSEAQLLAWTDRGALLRMSADLYRLGARSSMDVVGLVDADEVFRVPVGELSPVRSDLGRRVGPGVRRLPLDLETALGPHGGVVRGLQVALSAPSAPKGVLRVVHTVDLLATGRQATPDLLPELGVDGAVTSLRDGWLSGWFRAGPRAEEQVSLLLDGEPVVVRRPTLRGSEAEQAEGIRRFTFHLANLRRLGYGRQGHVSVRIAGSNVPLRGGSLTVADASRDLEHDADAGWIAVPVPRPSPGSRLRSRLVRVRRWRRTHPSDQTTGPGE